MGPGGDRRRRQQLLPPPSARRSHQQNERNISCIFVSACCFCCCQRPPRRRRSCSAAGLLLVLWWWWWWWCHVGQHSSAGSAPPPAALLCPAPSPCCSAAMMSGEYSPPPPPAAAAAPPGPASPAPAPGEGRPKKKRPRPIPRTTVRTMPALYVMTASISMYERSTCATDICSMHSCRPFRVGRDLRPAQSGGSSHIEKGRGRARLEGVEAAGQGAALRVPAATRGRGVLPEREPTHAASPPLRRLSLVRGPSPPAASPSFPFSPPVVADPGAEGVEIFKAEGEGEHAGQRGEEARAGAARLPGAEPEGDVGAPVEGHLRGEGGGGGAAGVGVEAPAVLRNSRLSAALDARAGRGRGNVRGGASASPPSPACACPWPRSRCACAGGSVGWQTLMSLLPEARGGPPR